MLRDVFIALLISGSIMLLVWYIKGRLVTPVPVGDCYKLIAVIQVSGNAGDVERTVESLLWLRENGTLPVEIVIADEGMDAETMQAVRAIVRKSDMVKLCEKSDVLRGV